MELLVAQQIIRQENLKDNVMLYGFISDASQFREIYSLICIDELWSSKIEMEQVPSWSVISRKHLFRDCRRVYANYKAINDIIRRCHIDTLYLGDVKNASCQLAAMSFHKRGLKIVFFEEGAGHYIMNSDYGKSGSFFDKLYAVIIDTFYYLPLFKCNYGYVIYWKGFNLRDLPMDLRYSIVPFYREPYDRLLKVRPMLSERLKAFIKEETRNIDTQNSVLLLTSPFYYDGINDNPNPYIKTIVDYATALGKDDTLHIKFHPRELDSVKKAIMSKLDALNISFTVIGERVRIPVEYYLQYLHYHTIVVFLCSTEFYNGYLFPKTKFVSIMEDYYNNCVEGGLTHLEGIKALISKHPSK